MKNTRISVMGQMFTLISVFEPKEYGEFVRTKNDKEITVLLHPSKIADFTVTIPETFGCAHSLYIEATVAAAAFLVNYRGLPLDEITFESGGQKIEVFHTGSDDFVVNVRKCKCLFTKHKIDVSGCEIECAVFPSFPCLCFVRSNDVSLFDAKNLKDVIFQRLPNLLYAVAFQEKQGCVRAILQSDHTRYRLDSLCVISLISVLCGGRDIRGTFNGERFFANICKDYMQISLKAGPLK